MNEIINKFLLAGDKFRLEMHLRKPEYMYSACHQTKNKERKKNLRNKKFIKDMFIKRSYTKSAFNIMLLMQISEICLEEQLLIKYYLMNHLHC